MTDDLSVIRRVLAGEVDAFRTLVERYQDPLFGLVRNLMPDRHECEDIAQNVFLSAYLGLHGFDPQRSSFRTWLYTIARNLTVNSWKKRRPLLREDWEHLESRPVAATMEEEEFYRQLDAGLAALPPEQKTVFVLAELHELPHEEIAHIEEIPLGTVKSRLSRAKEKLRAGLERPAEQP